MERPIKSEYLKNVHQIEYHTELNRYYSDLEKYVEYLEYENKGLNIALNGYNNLADYIQNNTSPMNAGRNYGDVALEEIKARDEVLRHHHIRCHASKDGECIWTQCPQQRNRQPHCIIDNWTEEEQGL